MRAVSELVESRDLLVNLILRELRGKYKRSVLGWAWSMLNPLATMAIFSIVFKVFLKIQIPDGDPSGLNNFPAYLLCGLLPWNFLANGMNASMGTLLGNAGLIKKVYFPRQILVYATVGSLGVDFLIEVGVLSAFILVLGNMILPWLVPALVLMVILAVFVIGIGLVVSVINVYFRDLQYLVGIALQFWFYSTPIVYPITLVPESKIVHGWDVHVRTIYSLNPMVRFVEGFRDVFYDLRMPALTSVLYMLAWAIIMLVVGITMFRRFEPRLAEEL